MKNENLLVGVLASVGTFLVLKKKKTESVGAIDASAVEKKFNHYFNDKDFELVEPFGSLWKSYGKKLYIRSKAKDLQGYNADISFLERQPFIEEVQPAGGDNVIFVKLK